MIKPLKAVCWMAALSLMAGGWLDAELEIEPPFPDNAGPELWIDGPLEDQVGGTKNFVDVAVDNSGRRVHVWGANSTGRDIFLRRWDSNGNPLEDPRPVNTTTADQQDNPRVAVSGDGSFLVIFDSREPDPDQGGALRIFVRSQAFGADGSTVGGEQLVTQLAPASLFPSDADVAALRTADGSAGGYIVVWRSNTSVGTDTNGTIQGCLVDSSGVPGSQFQVNSDDAPSQVSPTVTELADGGFLAAWTAAGVWGRRFNAAAGPIGNDFQIHTEYDSAKFEKDAAVGWDGSVAVVWADADEMLPASDAQEIRMRLFDSELAPLGIDFRVNTLLDTDQRWPRVADYGPAGFLVAWQSEATSGDDMGDSIEARLVTGPDEFDGPQVQFNLSDGSTAQDRPGSHGWYGRLATNWISPVLEGEPPNNVGFVVGRDIEHCIMCDDFEWYHPGGIDSLWRWSQVQGAAP